MKRKFSFDLPARLKIGPLRPDTGKATCHTPLDAPWMDSRPTTPKSVRPPLPADIDAELRAACNWLVTHPKPSHEIWDTSTSKPALDYGAIKYAEARPVSSVPALAKGHCLRSKEHSKHDLILDSTKYGHRPNVVPDDWSRPADVATKTARSRVEQLMMAPEAPRSVTATATGTSRQRSGSHSASAQQPQVVRPETREKKRASTRSDSVGTSGSTPHTDSTEYPWSASTAMTSAVMTPSRSNRASSQAINTGLESGVMPKAKPDAINAEWMPLELERHFHTQEKIQEKEQKEPVLCSATYVPSGTSPNHYRDFLLVPTRKPVSSRNMSVQTDRHPGPATGEGVRGRSSPTRRGRIETVEQEDRGRSPPRSYSRIGRASRAASRAASAAATRAGTIANEIFVLLDLRPAQPAQDSTEVRRSQSKAPSMAFSRGPTRPSSRARSISQHVKEYLRPGSGVSVRKNSIDSGRLKAPPLERERSWQLLRRGRSTFDLTRPGSSVSRATTAESHSLRHEKTAVGSNWESPPLPGLDKWEGAEADPAPTSILTHALSKMDLSKNPRVARMATRLSRRQAPPGSMSNPSSPRAFAMQPPMPNWRPPPSETLILQHTGELAGLKLQGGISREKLPQAMSPSQRVPRSDS